MTGTGMRITKRQIIACLMLVAVLSVSALFMKELIISVPLLLAMIFNRNISKTEMFYCIPVAFLFAWMARLEIVRFPIFQQAAELYENNKSILFWIRSGHIHAVRLVVVYPGVILAKALQVSTDTGNTLYSSALMVLMMYCMLRIMKTNGAESRISALLSGFFILVLSQIMNGRLIFVFFGVSLIALYELKFRAGETSVVALQIITAIGLLFSMVSSGTMMIVVAYVVLITPYRWKNLRSLKERRVFVFILAVCAVPVAGVLLPYVMVMIMKNINFYGGGFRGTINLVHHGMGRFLDTGNIVMVATLFAAGCLTVLTNVHMFRKLVITRDHKDLPLVLLVNLSIYGSLFGFSTGLTALIPFLVLAMEKTNSSIRIA